MKVVIIFYKNCLLKYLSMDSTHWHDWFFIYVNSKGKIFTRKFSFNLCFFIFDFIYFLDVEAGIWVQTVKFGFGFGLGEEMRDDAFYHAALESGIGPHGFMIFAHGSMIFAWNFDLELLVFMLTQREKFSP